ncbi:hypothetical protein EJ08DRAFT_665005 [Tothia fuscella]|uniref:Uncharacterized protein n=1 Tax=Tothia fuscella TaxID=1048955 RepID=A0A9P4NHQ7_9PEZI|nr:hypothetical protein EJ08DRAFT_665005 [Tothia fuscella]
MSWSRSYERPPKAESPYPEFPEEPIPHEDPVFPDPQDIGPPTPDAACDLTDSDEELNSQVVNYGTQKARQDQEQRWLGQKKWGFVIYRLTYADAVKWTESMSIFTAMARIWVVDDLELDESLALDVRENQELFGGGTGLANAREHFHSWVQSDDIKTEVKDEELVRADQQADCNDQIDGIHNQVQPPDYLEAPRYKFFIQIDAAAMESVLAEKGNSEWWRTNYCGWVNIVNSNLPLTDKR